MRKEQVIVIGAGTGGLFAANVLAQHFERVVILEKGSLPYKAMARKSVPQGFHLHVLLLGGLEMLSSVFPKAKKDLIARGAVELRAGLDQKIHELGEWLPQRDLGFTTIAQSRPLLEHYLLEQTAKNTCIRIVENARVKDILIKDDEVNGVDYLDSNNNEVSLETDLLIDASGLAGIFVNKLAKSYPGIDKTDVIHSNIAYASAILRKPKSFLDKKENVLIIPEPSFSAGGALIDIEDDQWIVSLHGRNGIVPPNDFEGWVKFARNSLPDDCIWKRVKDAELVGKIHAFKKPTSTFRRFDEVENIPVGYIPLGDVINSVNPIFGQGMTLGFAHAISLAEAISESKNCRRQTQKLYVEKACNWTASAWRRVSAYDSMFIKQNDEQKRNSKVLSSLALARQRKAYQDPATHLKIVQQGQMLLAE